MQPVICTCDVCKILDGDLTAKPCQFCGLCGKWLCERDQRDMFRRGLAMFSDKVTNAIKRFNNVPQKEA